MGRGQWPRQVLIWSLPAVAVLISFLWFKRRKTALRSDPGGTSTSPQRCGLEHLDSNCKPSTSLATADTQQVIAAFEKAVRDIETLRAIKEVVSVEEEEEEQKTSFVIKTLESVEKHISEYDNNREISSGKAAIFETPDLFTSTPLSNKNLDKQDGIAALDPSIILVLDKSVINTSVDTKLSSDNGVTAIDSLSLTPQVDNSNTIITGSQLDNSLTLESNAKVDSILDNSFVGVNSNTLEKNLNEANINESHCNDSKANKSSKKNLNKKLVNKKLVGPNNVVCNKTKDNNLVNNSNTNKTEKDKLKTNRKSKSVGKSCNGVSEMELSCNRLEGLKHSISKSASRSICGKDEEKTETDLPSVTSNPNTETGERDSANHSPAPADVMLASPSSMSNLSDAHSEGSSDSGKGCSDIPEISTPPAGGSSVSGDVDVTLAVYEFIIPQYMVGRLIGRYGGFLHDIRSKTHTHIFIKRHPETTKLKICAIEGGQPDIDAALEMIRQKFPLRRFPNLSLEKVSFVNIASSLCPLPHEQFQLQLIEGVNNDVILSSLVTAGHFFLQQPTHPSYSSLCQLNACMGSVYSSPEAPPLDTPFKDAICAAPAMGGWYRAQIIHLDEDNKTVDVRFLDYGGFLTLETSALRKIRGDLMLLPFQAVECLLANVVPASGDEEPEWSEEARLFVQNLTCGQILQAQVTQYTEQGIPLVFLYAMHGGQVVIVNNELVRHGFGEAETYVPEADTMDTEE